MKNWVFFLGCIAAYGQQVTISDTLTNSVGGGAWTGRITISLNSPSSASPLYYSTTSLAGWQYVLCVGVTGSECSATTAAGVITVPLYANSTITPAGTSYNARYQPTKGSPTTETWTVTASSTKLYQIRSSTVPTPTTTFQASQLALAAGSMVYGSSAGVGTALAAGTNGQVLALSGGYPAWTTNIAGNAGTATALAANGTNCAAGTFPLGVDASGAAESCTALPTTISGTANQITASASTGAVTLSFPAGGMTLPAQVTVNGLVDQEQLIVNSPAGSIVDIQTWRVNNAVVADITSTGAIELTGSAGVAFEINGGRGTISEPVGGSMTLASGNLSNGNQVFNAGASGAHYWQYGGTTKRYADTNGLWFNNAQTLYWKDSGGTHREILRGQSDDYTGLVSLGNGFKFWSRGFGTARMVLTDGGNLLIGTTTDNTTDKLQVTGSVSASGGFTGALTGNASTATALASTVASGRLWIGQGTGVPGSDSVICADTTNHRIGVGTCSPTAPLHLKMANIPNVGQLMLEGTGVAQISFYDGATLKSNFYHDSTGDAFVFRNATSGGPMAFYNNIGAGAFERFRLSGTSGNLLIGTTSDLGYGFHAANKGTNGNFLCFDPTATTGVTTCEMKAGQGQSTNSLLVVRTYSGSDLFRIRGDGYLQLANGGDIDIYTGNYTTSKVLLGPNISNGISLASDMRLNFSSTTATGGTKDLSLSRASAGVVQVGDGGANANGYLSAARIGVGTASPGQAVQVVGNVQVGGSSAFNNRVDFVSDSRSISFSLRGGGAALPGMFELYDNTAAASRMAFATTGNILIGGGTTDGNYRLDVNSSGSSGTFRVYDQTATTGNTKEVIRAGAGQSTNLTEWQNSAGTAMAFIDASGTFSNGGQTGAILNQTQVVQLGSDRLLVWGSTADYRSTKDLGLARNAAGILEINNGTAGTYRDLVARIHTWTNGTEATCSSTTRGQVVMVQGGAGVADTLRVCRKDAADAYAWTALY